MGVAHVGLVHCDPCKCKVKGFRAVSSIERNVSNRRHLQGGATSKVENFYWEEDGEWITDPTQVLYAANELYPESQHPWTERVFLSNVELALA